ncbi:MAG: sulfur carrier protein ThiS [Pseudohongiella sp.]|jgi:sulfur carrier protein|nr:sulfur carrier protein ThiS [Pseudohongiella sp.]
MNIVVNGKPQALEAQTNLQQLLENLQLGQGRIAIELNGEIVPRSLFQQTILQNDDSLEIVQAIGGG